jgi:hypothetical protein
MLSAERGYDNGKLTISGGQEFIEYFEEMALDTADHKPAKWFRYVDDTFVVWHHGSARLQQFLHHLNLPSNSWTSWS